MLRGTSVPDDGPTDVLVVDDQPDVASSTADILRSDGLSAETAATVDEALQIITIRDVRCIILDHQIVGDGETLLAGGRDLPPVIVMSGTDPDSLAEIEAVHGNRLFACMAKPVPPLDLIQVVRAAIANR